MIHGTADTIHLPYGHGYYHGYNDGYWAGYNHGYYDGYYGNYNPYYYNSYDNNSYYGPRGSASSNSPRPSGRQNSAEPRSLGEKYQIAQQEGRIPSMPSGVKANDAKWPEQTFRKNNTLQQEKNPAVIGRPQISDDKNQQRQHSSVYSSIQRKWSQDMTPATRPGKGIITDKNETGNPSGGTNQTISETKFIRQHAFE